jgi:hypothetical protein
MWLMIYIAVVDILFSINDISAQILKWATSHRVMLNPWFCQSTGMIFTLLTMSSVDGVGVLSLLRALSIVGDIEIMAIYWYTAIGVTIIVNASFSIFAAVNQVMRIMPSEAYCQASFRKSKISSIFSGFMIGKFTIVLLIVIVCYICITIKFYRIASRCNSKSNDNNCRFVENRRAKSYQRGVIVRLFILIFMYMLCFIPELIVIIYNLSTNTQRSPIDDAIVCSGITFTIIVNSVFLLFYNQENRSILVNMLPNWVCICSDSFEIEEFRSL